MYVCVYALVILFVLLISRGMPFWNFSYPQEVTMIFYVSKTQPNGFVEVFQII